MLSKLNSILLVVTSYILYLGFTDQLNFYIHPRYIVFTVVMSVVALILLLLNSYFSTTEDSEHNHLSKLALLPLGLIVISALLLPVKSLTSATVSQRSTDSGSIVATTGDKPLSVLFAGSSRGLKLTDWSRLLASNQDPSYYASKPAKISGFVYDSKLGNDTVGLARFVVTCCAVDAQPVIVPVQIKDWQKSYKKDQWLEVEGTFKPQQTVKGEQLVLVPEAVNEIQEPKNPYAN